MPALNRAISAFIMCSPSATRRLKDSRSAASDACGSSATSAGSPSFARIFFNSSSVTCRQSESSSRTSRSGTAGIRAKRPTWGSSIKMSKSPEPHVRRKRTDSNVSPFTLRCTCRKSARLGLFIRPPELGTAPRTDQRCLALLDEPLAGNFTDDTFRPQQVEVAPDVIGQQLANGGVGQPHKSFLQNRADAERAHHPLKWIRGSREPSLLLDEALHAGCFFFAVVVVGHASTCIAVIPS